MVLVFGESEDRQADLNEVLIVKVEFIAPARAAHKSTIVKLALNSDQHVLLMIDCEKKSMAAPFSLDT